MKTTEERERERFQEERQFTTHK